MHRALRAPRVLRVSGNDRFSRTPGIRPGSDVMRETRRRDTAITSTAQGRNILRNYRDRGRKQRILNGRSHCLLTLPNLYSPAWCPSAGRVSLRRPLETRAEDFKERGTRVFRNEPPTLRACAQAAEIRLN